MIIETQISFMKTHCVQSFESVFLSNILIDITIPMVLAFASRSSILRILTHQESAV